MYACTNIFGRRFCTGACHDANVGYILLADWVFGFNRNFSGNSCTGPDKKAGRRASSKVDAKAKLPTHYLLKAENGLELPSLVLMEQLRTIDKRRLETYIGHLEEQHIRRLNRALAVSVGLIEETSKNLIMCLCPACANNFYGTGSYYLRRVHPGRVEKDICTYCGQRPGFDYEVVKKKERK